MWLYGMLRLVGVVYYFPNRLETTENPHSVKRSVVVGEVHLGQKELAMSDC